MNPSTATAGIVSRFPRASLGCKGTLGRLTSPPPTTTQYSRLTKRYASVVPSASATRPLKTSNSNSSDKPKTAAPHQQQRSVPTEARRIYSKQLSPEMRFILFSGNPAVRHVRPIEPHQVSPPTPVKCDDTSSTATTDTKRDNHQASSESQELVAPSLSTLPPSNPRADTGLSATQAAAEKRTMQAYLKEMTALVHQCQVTVARLKLAEEQRQQQQANLADKLREAQLGHRLQATLAAELQQKLGLNQPLQAHPHHHHQQPPLQPLRLLAASSPLAPTNAKSLGRSDRSADASSTSPIPAPSSSASSSTPSTPTVATSTQSVLASLAAATHRRYHTAQTKKSSAAEDGHRGSSSAVSPATVAQQLANELRAPPTPVVADITAATRRGQDNSDEATPNEPQNKHTQPPSSTSADRSD
ncbi:hypothetical protein BJ085DRAFT_40492 [Dimargaris cristalligena]|uniref:Uncharacterized protein n=1 Tax=Dimargaris cristalligena TaxID=215637 RepID=A0A4P9ZYN2_9FUNG|nr:hypothetical protein BJ085DRAFT_40492 [Dimargaris cristalligena]|eukprot:RKP38062.1 hypothetical protein BJ085DRAFT_40492 [Dimargaris cristalligena]